MYNCCFCLPMLHTAIIWHELNMHAHLDVKDIILGYLRLIIHVNIKGKVFQGNKGHI